MQTKLFSNPSLINWIDFDIHMPFAPLYELANKYKLVPLDQIYTDYVQIPEPSKQNLQQTFEFKSAINFHKYKPLIERIKYNTTNTVAALDSCTTNCISVHIGGGYHHAGKYPNTGYAYSLINDICWAVDYQLEQNKTIGIIDLDFHFGGGTWKYYRQISATKVYIADLFHPKGILYKHRSLNNVWAGLHTLEPPQYIPDRDKYIVNLGTDWLSTDSLFGKYGNMESDDLLNVWIDTIGSILDRRIPLAITCGGGYGSRGLRVYEGLIDWLQAYSPTDSYSQVGA